MFVPLFLASACAPEAESASADAVEQRRMRIVEVLPAPARADRFAFIELRNDGDQPLDMSSMALVVGRDGAPTALRPLAIEGALDQSGEPLGTRVTAGGLALVIDEASADRVVDVACESPIVTTRESLGSAHAALEDALVSALEIQRRRHCVPVFTVDRLDEQLAAADQITLDHPEGALDTAAVELASASLGVAFERRGPAPEAFDRSPLGSTPGTRNFYRSDAGFLVDSSARLPLFAMSASPWRVGDHILELRREAAALRAQGNGAEADALEAEAEALEKGEKLPHNPLVEPFVEAIARAEQKALGAFYQINEPEIIEAYVQAKERGADVRLTTDASFIDDPHYTEGFARLDEAGVPITFDVENGRNRSSLSHNKFTVLDSRWVWTGSFNPIEDEPSRIHADNAVLMETPEGAALHEQEFETLFGGTFGTDKRETGIGGGRFSVDGAPVAIRYSPGMTASLMKRRAQELAATGDPEKACRVTLSSGREAIPERYRALEPCGGPYDLIVGEVARATSSVYFVSFSISLSDVADVMIERFNDAAVEVRGVVDPTVSTSGVAQKLIDAGADVRYTPNSDPACPDYVTPKTTCPKNPNKVWLHHKFILVDYGTDHPVVITGSHNMSDSAEGKNDETLVVIRDRAIAETYYRIFREAYDHPQTMGVRRNHDGLPELAITEVRATVDPAEPQMVEIANFGSAPATLEGLELWNRRGDLLPIEGGATLEPGARAVVAIGDAAALGVQAATTVVSIEPNSERPLIEPTTSLVLRSAADGRWIATWDPYTAEQNLPEGVTPAMPGSFSSWAAFDRGTIDAMMVELLGNNTTPTAPLPTWEPAGLYSDWGDEHIVTPLVMILFNGPRAQLTPDAAGTPGW